MPNNYCRVCGLWSEEVSWDQYDKILSYGNICDCCGVESGLEDFNLASVRLYRQAWLNSGAKWFKPKLKPENWYLEEQMKNIPERFR
jgi:hypothetical protein